MDKMREREGGESVLHNRFILFDLRKIPFLTFDFSFDSCFSLSWLTVSKTLSATKNRVKISERSSAAV